MHNYNGNQSFEDGSNAICRNVVLACGLPPSKSV